jgi:hypothetical protein
MACQSYSIGLYQKTNTQYTKKNIELHGEIIYKDAYKRYCREFNYGEGKIGSTIGNLFTLIKQFLY